VEAILEEAEKDYDLLMVGASEGDGDPADLFTSGIDELLRLAPCPVMVAKGRLGKHNWPPRRILVPTNGSIAARHAADLAFAVADEETEVLVLNVVEEEAAALVGIDHHGAARRRLAAARDIVDELCRLGRVQGVRTRTHIELSPEPEAVITRLAEGDEVDLVVLGTGVRAASERLFLGPRVERILASVRCPLVLINSG
jgi:nucleotide-binding universal stress UspA family protein